MYTEKQRHQLAFTPPGVEVHEVTTHEEYLEVTWSDDKVKDCVSRLYPDGTIGNDLTLIQDMEGYWMDPAGGIHLPDSDDEADFDDPAAMYE